MNIEGWELDLDSLPGPPRATTPHLRDVGFLSPDAKRLAVVYSIDEIRMGWEVGLLAVYENRESPKCVLNPDRFLCCCPSDAIIWLSNEMLATKKHYYSRRKNALNVPFALLDLCRSQYSFIAMPNSYSYTLTLTCDGIHLTQHTNDDLFAGYDGRQYSVSDMEWYPLTSLADFDSTYADSAA